MSDSDPIPLQTAVPIPLRPRQSARPIQVVTGSGQHMQAATTAQVRFNKVELNEILDVYGRMVAAGEWRDYAIDMGREKAVFSIFRRTAEYPLYRVEKNPKLARKQGAYSVVGAQGQVLKRGTELKRVLEVLDKRLRAVD